KSELNVLSYKIGLESVEARLVVYQKNETVFEEDIKLLKLDVMLRDNALAELRKNFEKAEKERNDLKAYFTQILDFIQKSNHESDNIVHTNIENDRYKTCEGYHVVHPPYTGTFMPSKPNLVFTDDPNASESVANVVNVELRLDDSVYKCKVTESIFNESNVETNVTKSCTHSIEKPKTDRLSVPIIEEQESDNDNDSTISPISDQPKHTPIKIDFVKPVEYVECGENEKQAEKPTSFTQNPKEVKLEHHHALIHSKIVDLEHHNAFLRSK
nr:hypothetical protein [Tanacetum cinerariifolium]